MVASSAAYGYIASKQTRGSLATDKDRETAMSYQEKARQAKEEENNLIKNITDQLRGLYSRLVTGNSTDYKKLNIIRTYLHYKFGNGQTMYVDITGMHIPTISAKRDFNDQVGKEASINTFSSRELSMVGVTLGSIDFEYLGNLKVRVTKSDRYDFDWQKDGESDRNFYTLLGSIVHNMPMPVPNPVIRALTTGGRSFDIEVKGEATINP